MESKLAWSNILLTGPPGIGKTTLIRKASEKLKSQGVTVTGFYTEEVRNNNRRIGFDVCCLDGRRGNLARINSHVNGPKVGQYTVDVESFENLALSSLKVEKSKPSVLIIDEIGKMELFSRRFQALVEQHFSISGNLLRILATVPVAKGSGIRFVETLKARKDVILYTITRDNRDNIVEEIAEKLTQPV